MRHASLLLLAVIGPCCLSSSALPAQVHAALVPGALVRLPEGTAAPCPDVGTVLAVEPDGVIVESRPRHVGRTARGESPCGEVTRRRLRAGDLLVAHGTRTQAMRGMRYGALFGGVVGAVIGYTSGTDGDRPRGWFAFDRGDGARFYGVAGAMAGGMLGALAGAVIRTERWEPAVAP